MSVTILAGPPCSGKTTYAHELALEGDQVLDWDQVFVDVAGRPMYDQPPELAPAVEAEFRRRLEVFRHGYVIRTAPRKQYRAILRRIHRARSIVLAVPAEECIRRLEASGRPEEVKAAQIPAIRRWWAEFEPSSSGDEFVIRPDSFDERRPTR